MCQVSEEMRCDPAVSPGLLSTCLTTGFSLAALLSSAVTSQALWKGSNLHFANQDGSDRISLCCSFASPLASRPHTNAGAETAAGEVSISPPLKLISKGLKEEGGGTSASYCKKQWDLGGHVAQVGLICGLNHFQTLSEKASKANGRFVFCLFCPGVSVSW